ncbi:acetyl-CoA C-acyltransferase [Cupriavidus basilensis]|uniref:3-ketoacyl-CoA thiolase or Acetyl-CoA acetyltransferase n=1 Tax=Cupriavidus basilensis TaxID=68895 RepID=A0A0C4YPN8_9BURK|nr:acetyl-CoA C-acyltransferase [Cupriavidus basilensis]AJG22531.1 3-ketoacyl-CoA thiolase or Acetyl-CoA acetyltransferase [Cupriavidus basilensis]
MTNTNDPVVIMSAARTPIGGFQGALASLTAPELGGAAIQAAVERAKIDPASVQELLMGCVLPAGLGQAPARQASINAGLPLGVPCTTISKVCGSGMKSVMLAHDLLLAGSNDLMVAGGMESMSNAPYLLPKARAGYRLGHGKLIDHMFFDGLEDHYGDDTRGRLMGTFAEDCADAYRFSRHAQDEWAVLSTLRAQAAIQAGHFAWETVPLTVAGRKSSVTVREDELPLKADLSRIPTLKPAFRQDGTVTPANSSSISDGAAALVLTRQSVAERMGVRPLARIVGHASHAQEPAKFATAPIDAIRKLLDRTGWATADVDLWEINEAFAVVPMAAVHDLRLDRDQVNVHGGACALGHPIGASGARILVTLLGALRRIGGRRGIASLCIGGGEATAVAVELV